MYLRLLIPAARQGLLLLAPPYVASLMDGGFFASHVSVPVLEYCAFNLDLQEDDTKPLNRRDSKNLHLIDIISTNEFPFF